MSMYPSDPADAVAAQSAAMAVSRQRQADLMANAAAGHAGDPKPAESTQQPEIGKQVSVT